MGKNKLSRRDFLLRVSAAGALGIGATSVLSACGGGETAPPPEPAAPAPAAATVVCDDVSGLTEQEIGMRAQLQYVDVATDPAKPCTTCALYIPVVEGASCGGCNLIKGPIAPAGGCLSWAPMPS